MATPPSRDSICAIVVTYRPDSALSDRLQNVRPHARELVIIDNGSGPRFRVTLENARQSTAAMLVANSGNRGLAAALNQGIKIALERDYPWALLFDQDSTALLELALGASRAFEGFPEPHRIAVIGADHDNPFHYKKRRRYPNAGAFREMRTVITSGSLINLSILRQIGGFRENLFIDSVDDEYCMRARRCGFAVIEATTFGITHRIGKPQIVTLLGKPRSTSNHPPIRRYYMARNRLVLAANYFFFDPVWSLFLVKSLLREILFIFAFEKEKHAKFKATLLGIWDALRSRMGKFDKARL